MHHYSKNSCSNKVELYSVYYFATFVPTYIHLNWHESWSWMSLTHRMRRAVPKAA